jgi:inosine/guanosine/xanthosine phosphorylase family protein
MNEVRRLPSPGDGVSERIAEAIRERSPLEPVVGVVLGSGLSEAVETVRAAAVGEQVELSYADLPGFPATTVVGHAGRLWLGTVGDRGVAIFQGRIHFYEGHGMALASITSRVAAELGARTMVLTAATGSVDPDIEAGTLVVLRDHLNLMGQNPLTGWRYPDGSPAFVDVSQVYDPELADLALASARAHLVGTDRAGRVRQGVYVRRDVDGPGGRRRPSPRDARAGPRLRDERGGGGGLPRGGPGRLEGRGRDDRPGRPGARGTLLMWIAQGREGWAQWIAT